MPHISFASLRVRLLILVLLAIVPALGLVLYTGVEQRHRAIAEVQETALRLTRLAANNHERLIEGAHQLLTVLAQLPQVREGDSAACNALFANLLKQYPLYTNLGAVELDGDLFCSAVPLTQPLNVADRPHIQRALQTGGFAISEYQIGPITGRPSVNFAYPVLDETGQVQAAVAAGLDLNWFNQFAAEAQLPEGATLTVIDHRAVILARYPNPEQWVGQSLPDAPLFQTILAQGQGAVEVDGVDGVSRLYAFNPLGSIPDAEATAYVSVGIPTEIAFVEVDRALVRNLAALGLVAALGLAVAWFGSEVFILGRVRALVNATKRLSAGDLDARTGLTYGSGELSQLARAFDEMVQALQQREDERKQAEVALRESQDRLAGVVNSAMDAIITVDAEQRIILFNTAAEQMFHCAAAKAIGQPLEQFIPERFRLRHQEHIRTFSQTGVTSRAMNALGAVRGLRSDGQEFPIEASISQVEAAGQKVYTVILRDITERERAEEAQRFIAEASLLLANSIDYETTLTSLANLAVPHIADWCAVDVVAEDGTLQRLAVAHVDPAKVAWAHELQRRFPYDPNAPSGVAQVLRTGQPEFYPEIPDELLVASAPNAETLQILREIGFTSVIIAPLVTRGQALGAITLVTAESRRRFDSKDLALAEDLARRAAIAIDNARLYRLAQEEITERKQMEQALQEAHDELEVRVEQRTAELTKANEQLAALYKLGQIITAPLRLKAVLDVIVRSTAQLLETDTSVILLLDEAGEILTIKGAYGISDRAVKETRDRVGESIAGRVVQSGQPIIANDLPNDPRFYNPAATQEGLLACISVPLMVGEKIIGTLDVHSKVDRHAFTEAHIQTLKMLASQAAIAIENARLYEEVQRARDELEERVQQRTVELIAANEQLHQENTERRQSEEALRLSEERFAKAFRASPAALSITRLADGCFVDVNESFFRIFGYNREELIGHRSSELNMFTNPDERAELVRLLREQGWVREYEMTIRTKSGEIRNILFSTEEIELDGEAHILAILFDITERKRAEEQLKQVLAELERSNAELQQFAYVASHDLQEPLRMVASYTQLLARRYKGKLDADADDFISFAVDGANRMQRLINDLLTYSRVGTRGKALEPVNSEVVLGQVLANLQAAVTESDAVVTHEALPTVLGDETQLGQLFQNLIGNALKFHNTEPPRVHISAELEGKEWLFSIRDNGIGLEPQYAERIFIIFQRLHNKAEYPGTGIGLAICKRIVERHGGRIWTESQPGQGATFYFTLPVMEANSDRQFFIYNQQTD